MYAEAEKEYKTLCYRHQTQKNSLMKKAIKMPDEKHIEHIEEQRTKFVTF